MSVDGGLDRNTIHSYFIGPKGANLPDFRANVNTILDELLETRLNYFPEDGRFISAQARRSKHFQRLQTNLRLAVQKTARLLGEHSAPFWSPRYQAHMCMDLTMPSMLGYFMTMLYNPNNVALEVSPISTLVELKTGNQLCDLFGYNTDPKKSPEYPLAWGHITCDGSIANLESIWVARNLKFYPLALYRAIHEGKLKFISKLFKVKTCKVNAREKLFSELTSWELLNLRPQTVLDLPEDLNAQFGISSKFLEDALRPYNIQMAGRNPLEDALKITRPIKYLVAKTRHYSWPKGAAVAGLGSGNVIGIEVDRDARIDISRLETQLQECVESNTAVYAVVAIVGSTEEGAVDRLSEIVKLRTKFQDEHGLSFLVHADAAWGGYFATMLHRNEDGPIESERSSSHRSLESSHDSGHSKEAQNFPRQGLVPALQLKPSTEQDLLALKYADSITVDPHKAGYIPYPAGSLVYRDGRMRHLVTWGSNYLSQGSADNIGIYGVEGSKPGAAAMSAWFSNQTIGLNPSGYGLLLGEASFTSGRLSAYYATMDNDYFTCIPLNMLPSEKGGANAFNSDEVNKERQWIRQHILNKDNSQILKSAEAMNMIRQLGSDSCINAFALNWKYKDKRLNEDVEEANYLMKRVTDRLSITSANTDPTKLPMFLTSTKFEPEDYGECAGYFMERMGLQRCNHGLFVLRNVVMNPFPTEMNFLQKLMSTFEEVVKEEVGVCRQRNHPSYYGKFLVKGPQRLESTSEVFLIFQTSFYSATRRQQLILTGQLDDNLTRFYNSLKQNEDLNQNVILKTADKIDIKEDVALPIESGEPVRMEFEMYRRHGEHNKQIGHVTFKSVVKSRPLNTINQDQTYPEDFMPFYLYGTSEHLHISHVLVRAPNIALSASNVTFAPELPEQVKQLLPQGLILTLSDVPEAALQPFPVENSLLPKRFFFREKQSFRVDIYEDPNDATSAGPGLLENLKNKLYEGTMTLSEAVLVDTEEPNRDQFVRITMEPDSWQKELDEIANVMNGSVSDDD